MKVSLIWVVVAAYFLFLFYISNGSMLFLGLIVVALFLMWVVSKKTERGRIRAVAEAEADPRAPVLFLRQFSRDNVKSDSMLTAFGKFTPLGNLLDLTFTFGGHTLGGDTLEARIASCIYEDIGPFIKAGGSRDWLPHAGCLKLYLEQDHWHEDIISILKRAVAVVAIPGESPSLDWEFSLLRRFFDPNRIFLLTEPANVEHGKWSLIRNFLAKTGWAMPLQEPHHGCVIGFDDQYRPLVLATNALTAEQYVLPIREKLQGARNQVWTTGSDYSATDLAPRESADILELPGVDESDCEIDSSDTRYYNDYEVWARSVRFRPFSVDMTGSLLSLCSIAFSLGVFFILQYFVYIVPLSLVIGVLSGFGAFVAMGPIFFWLKRKLGTKRAGVSKRAELLVKQIDDTVLRWWADRRKRNG